MDDDDAFLYGDSKDVAEPVQVPVQTSGKGLWFGKGSNPVTHFCIICCNMNVFQHRMTRSASAVSLRPSGRDPS